MSTDLKKSNKKFCRVCERVLEDNTNNFFKGKHTCKECCAKHNKEKYQQKKENERVAMMVELKAQALPEYGQLIEENRDLRTTVKDMKVVLNIVQTKLTETVKTHTDTARAQSEVIETLENLLKRHENL